MSSISFSVRSLTFKVRDALAKGHVNVALCLVHDFVERIITEPICTAQVFSSRDLDLLCLDIGRYNLGVSQIPLENPWPNSKNRSLIIYIVSRLQKSGGHSRLIQDFIGAQPEKTHLVLSTEIGGPSDRHYLEKALSGNDNVRIIYAHRSNFQSRLLWLQSILLALEPEHVHLFNHHQDSVAVAALVPEIGLRGSFYHHGDHHLCLGVHLNHLIHVDLHPMGYHYCRDELGIENQYLPLTFVDNHCVRNENDFMFNGHLTTATAARFNKVEIPYYVSYLDVVPMVLKVTGGRHIHIGNLTPWALRRIYNQLKKHKIDKDRFVYIEWTSSVWRALHANRVDIYIASFPYGAGLTLVEAMGSGVPVIMHQHMYARVLSGLELAYPEAFSWSNPEDLLAHLKTLLPEMLAREGRLARQQYERFHKPEILKAYLSDTEILKFTVPPLSAKFRARHDEWAAWVETQLSIYRFFYRFTYRALRKIRRLIGYRGRG